MISNKYIAGKINEIEKEYEKCWNILSQFKHRSIPNNRVQNLYEFQPLLTNSLFELDKIYRAITQEEKNIVSKKANIKKVGLKII